MSLSSSSGSFVSTTSSLDVSEIGREPDVKKLIARLYQALNNISIAVNLKDTGYYPEKEFVCGQLFFPSDGSNSSVRGNVAYRSVFRKVINVGTLPNSTSKNVPHYMNTTGYTFTRIYGTATDPSAARLFIPLPYFANGSGSSVALWVNGTDVKLQTSGNMSNYTESHVVLEYIKT